MTMMPDDDDLFKALEQEFEEMNLADVENFDEMNEMDLRDRFIEIEDQLKKLGQVLWPHSQEARDLHSQRNAIQVVLRSRGKEA